MEYIPHEALLCTFWATYFAKLLSSDAIKLFLCCKTMRLPTCWYLFRLQHHFCKNSPWGIMLRVLVLFPLIWKEERFVLTHCFVVEKSKTLRISHIWILRSIFGIHLLMKQKNNDIIISNVNRTKWSPSQSVIM